MRETAKPLYRLRVNSDERIFVLLTLLLKKKARKAWLVLTLTHREKAQRRKRTETLWTLFFFKHSSPFFSLFFVTLSLALGTIVCVCGVFGRKRGARRALPVDEMNACASVRLSYAGSVMFMIW
jgi:hypothetical protein